MELACFHPPNAPVSTYLYTCIVVELDMSTDGVSTFLKMSELECALRFLFSARFLFHSLAVGNTFTVVVNRELFDMYRNGTGSKVKC